MFAITVPFLFAIQLVLKNKPKSTGRICILFSTSRFIFHFCRTVYIPDIKNGWSSGFGLWTLHVVDNIDPPHHAIALNSQIKELSGYSYVRPQIGIH